MVERFVDRGTTTEIGKIARCPNPTVIGFDPFHQASADVG
jgi:hypothetical protein